MAIYSAPTPLHSLPADLDLKLVVSDMDGTLLDDSGQIPDSLWPLLAKMRMLGILFVPASGRQYAQLLKMFQSEQTGMPFIAENGTVVIRDGVELSSAPLPKDLIPEIVELVRTEAAAGSDIGVVVCTAKCAYVERHDERFVSCARPYYANLEKIDDVLAVPGKVIKIALYDFENAEINTAPLLSVFRQRAQIAVSGQHWIDVMALGTSKGSALVALQRSLGIDQSETAVFGDYLNDLEMMPLAQWSFATANAHPEIIKAANFVAPAASDQGVVTVLDRLLNAKLHPTVGR